MASQKIRKSPFKDILLLELSNFDGGEKGQNNSQKTYDKKYFYTQQPFPSSSSPSHSIYSDSLKLKTTDNKIKETEMFNDSFNTFFN